MSDNVLPPILLHLFCREPGSEMYVSHPVTIINFSANLYRTSSGVLHLYRAVHPEDGGRTVAELEVYGNIHFLIG